jgi:hypothetical protein
MRQLLLTLRQPLADRPPHAGDGDVLVLGSGDRGGLAREGGLAGCWLGGGGGGGLVAFDVGLKGVRIVKLSV